MRNNENGFAIVKPINCNNKFMLHVILRDGEEIVYDRLLRISEQTSSYSVESQFNTAEVSTFDEDGELLHKECNHYIESISLGMNVLSSPGIKIKDKLTKRLRGSYKEKAENVNTKIHKTPSVVSYDKSKYKQNKRRINDLFFNVDPEFKGGFFKKYNHDDEKGEAFVWLIDLINSAKHVTIIDPYFSSKVVTESLRRVHQDIHLDIVTSLEISNEFSEKDTIDACKKVLHEYAHEIACSFKIINHTKENGKKLFHDRFLVTHNSKNKTVYMLSNSLSGYCESFPFTYMPLDDSTSEKVLAYFEELDSDGKREVLWDSSLLPEKTNKIISYGDKENEVLSSSYVKKGICFLLNDNIKDIAKDSKGLITLVDIGFKVDSKIFHKLYQKNILRQTNTFTKEEVTYVLMTLGELCARQHSENIFEDTIKWLKVQKKYIDLQEVFDEICTMSNEILHDQKHNEDVSLPTADSVRKFFEYTENYCIYGARVIERNWGLFFSSYFLIQAEPLDITIEDLSTVVVQNILAGFLHEAVPVYETIDKELAVNLLQSKPMVLKILGMTYVTISVSSPKDMVKIFQESNISDQLIIYALMRRYKELMHSYYRASRRKEQQIEILMKLDDVAEVVSDIWEHVSVEQKYLEDIYACFFDKNEFIYRFGSFLNNTQEKNRLFELMLIELEKSNGWNKNFNAKQCFYNVHELSNLKWAGEAYLDLYQDNVMKGLLNWNSNFIESIKKKLEEPMYKKGDLELANKFCALLFFVSNFLIFYMQRSGDLSKIEQTIKALYGHTSDLFECEKAKIYAVNEEMYHGLLSNLTELLLIQNKISSHEMKILGYPFSSYLLCTSQDTKVLENESTYALQEITRNTNNPVYFIVRWMMLLSLNLHINEREMPFPILEVYTELLEKLGVSNRDILEFPANMIKVYNGEVNSLSIVIDEKEIYIESKLENVN